LSGAYTTSSFSDSNDGFGTTDVTVGPIPAAAPKISDPVHSDDVPVTESNSSHPSQFDELLDQFLNAHHSPAHFDFAFG